jgi:hypothetical protein
MKYRLVKWLKFPMHESGIRDPMSKLTNENHLISQVNSNGKTRLKLKANDVVIWKYEARTLAWT